MSDATPRIMTFHPRLEGRRVRRGLQRAAPAILAGQKFFDDMATLLLERLEVIRVTPRRVLEVGDRSGRVAAAVRQRWPGARVVSLGLEASLAAGLPQRPMVVGSPSPLPFARDCFDLVLSCMGLHWGEGLAPALRECRRVLREDGLVLFSTVGEGNLRELRRALGRYDRERFGVPWPRVLAGPELHELGDLLVKSGYVEPVVDREAFAITVPDAAGFLRRLNRLGAGNPHQPRHRGLTGKGMFAGVERAWRAECGVGLEERLPLTVEILFGHGWKGSPRSASSQGGACGLPG